MSEPTQAYCVKCREKRDMLNPTAVYLTNGRAAVTGECAVCGTKLMRMGRSAAHDSLPMPDLTVTRAAAPAKSTNTKAAGKATGKTSAKAKKRATTKTKSKKKSSTSTSAAKSVKSTKTAATSKTTPTADQPAKNGRKRTNRLVIVESPAKARTVGRFLGDGYTVKASKGHVRDLLVTQLSVDVQNDFEPKYRVPNDKRDTVKDLQKAAENADEIYLATDPDREGEAIAWHLIEATDLTKKPIKRVVFHEITDDAVHHAFAHPRTLDMNLVNAQQARRILDRIVGYNITELLWDRVRNRLSAGRVQSIALRLVVERENEIAAFVPIEYWTIDAEVEKQAKSKDNRPFIARLVKIKGEEAALGSESIVLPHLDVLERSLYQVTDVKKGTRQRKPSAPFTTSTLQQEASRRFGFTAKRTMKAAQELYEGIDIGAEGTVGLITYMRTDSTSVSEQAQKDARVYIEGRFGKNYMPDKPPVYKTKTKGAQEAHEAIRPTGVNREPERLKALLTADQFKLYKLIWERFLASQMIQATYDTIRVDIAAGLSADNLPYELRSSGSRIKFAGFLALYEDTRDDDAEVDSDEGRILPELAKGELLNLRRLMPEQHFTQPPPRYTEATLVRTLEEHGIGRPSSYAPTVGIIQERDYVEKQDKRLIPTETGKLVNQLLVNYFPDVMDYQFTARMEDQLDVISEGGLQWQPMLRDFYTPFEQQLGYAREHMPRHQQEEFVGRECPKCSNPLVIRYGRWGKFIGCSTYPTCNHTEPYLEFTGVTCPKCGDTEHGQLVERKTRRGRTFYGCSRFPECDYSAWRLPGKPSRRSEDDDSDSDGNDTNDELMLQDESA